MPEARGYRPVDIQTIAQAALGLPDPRIVLNPSDHGGWVLERAALETLARDA